MSNERSVSSVNTARELLGLALAALLAHTALACSTPSDATSLEGGVVFSYPLDQQLDVPVSARLVVGFSEPVNIAALERPCTGESGAFCVVGPDGPVDGTIFVVDSAIHFSGGLEPATPYQVWARPELLSSTSSNLSASAPLLSFTTRSDRPRAGEAPTIVSISSDGSIPFVTFSTLRVLFSEPIDRSTLSYGDSVVLEDERGQLVPAVILTDGIHLSIDPIDDLEASAPYTLRLSRAIVDLGGEPLETTARTVTPADAEGSSGLVTRTLISAPENVDNSANPGLRANVIDIAKPLLGEQSLSIATGAVSVDLADPSLFGGPIPLTIRRGGGLSTGDLDIRFSGEVPSNLETGDLGVRFISDASGVLYRNPFRPPETVPSDPHAPVFFVLTFDLALSASEPKGSAIVSQNVLHVQATGTAIVGDGSLILEVVAGLEVDILGVSTGDGNLALTLAANREPDAPVVDGRAPTLVSSYPVDGQPDFRPSDSLMLLFDEPVDETTGRITLARGDGAEVAVRTSAVGGALLVTPTSALAYGTDYQLGVEAISDLVGNPLANQPVLSFSTPPFAATSVAPTLTALRPGAPCAIVDPGVGDGAADSGRCSGGNGGDVRYRPFTIGPDEPAEAYFTQPMDGSSIALGEGCGQGSVRIEELDEDGACLAVVPGALVVLERGFRFLPQRRWQLGSRYRMVLIAGTNNRCDPGEICGANNRPLNSAPLAGSGGGSGGGPAVSIQFSANDAAYPGAYIPIELTPATDVNGSGFVAVGDETPQPANRVVFEVASTSGVVSSARFTGADCVPQTPAVEGCLYLSGTVPILLEEAASDCTIAQGASGPIVADRCVPLILTPQAFYATSANLEASALLLTPSVTIGQVILRIIDRPERPARAYIYEANGETRLGGDLELYVDAPDLDISIPGSGHDLRSRLLPVSLDGPVTFEGDGRVRINMSNTLPIRLAVQVDFLNIGLGGIELEIPTGGLTLQLVSPLIRSGQLSQKR